MKSLMSFLQVPSISIVITIPSVLIEQLSPEEQTVEEDDPWINVNKLPTLLQEKMEEFRAKR